MARKQRHPEHENHERWLVSYADFITLLFAFFVVMFASSQADKAKAKQLSEAVKDAFENGGATRKVSEILGGAADNAGKGSATMRGPGGASEKGTETPTDLALSLELLSRELQAEIQAGRVTVTMEPRGLVVSLQEATFFASGEDTLLPSAIPSIKKIAAVIQKLPNKIRLEGHTDAVPIANNRFSSNWALSSARGIAVLSWLTTVHGIPQNRMAIGAYADTAPKDTNGTEAGRARNRRVDITILNEVGSKQEPVSSHADGQQSATSKASKT